MKKIYLLLIIMAGLSMSVRAQVSNYKAYTLFVYNFTKYVQWPDGAIKDEFVIGVFGKSPIYEELQKMSVVKKAGDKSIRVSEITEGNMSSDLHILFITEEKSLQMSSVLQALKGKPVLIVGEKTGLIEKGAGISFLSDNNNLRFQINSNSITAQNLKVSKTLEALAVASK